MLKDELKKVVLSLQRRRGYPYHVQLLINAHRPHYLLAMERRERRRKALSKASTVVETKAEAGRKPAKLVLKASSALSPRGETHKRFYTRDVSPLNPTVEKKPRVSTILDNCLGSETPEEVLEQLLSFTDADINGLSLLAERSLGVLRELWRRWREKGDVCGVIVRVFVELVTSGSGEWEEVRGGLREFVLQIPDHGKPTSRCYQTHTCYQQIFLFSQKTTM